eukprot:TRINITY_DN2281_c0_g1_i4.p2 TRINITY_DN2281_c0_g1~~TRINITY_DN2281_c0_g1_i4.p2  ORF type:complete len:227 (-),score=11.43 TRINITY_DN2281_c0_g1_i4:190-795(-)
MTKICWVAIGCLIACQVFAQNDTLQSPQKEDVQLPEGTVDLQEYASNANFKLCRTGSCEVAVSTVGEGAYAKQAICIGQTSRGQSLGSYICTILYFPSLSRPSNYCELRYECCNGNTFFKFGSSVSRGCSCGACRQKRHLLEDHSSCPESVMEYEPCCTEYEVKQGESICYIAQKFELECQDVQELNQIEQVEVGDIIQIC